MRRWENSTCEFLHYPVIVKNRRSRIIKRNIAKIFIIIRLYYHRILGIIKMIKF